MKLQLMTGLRFPGLSGLSGFSDFPGFPGFSLFSTAAAAPLRPRIALLATGGTIAGRAASPTETARYEAAALDLDTLLADLPALQDAARITGEQICRLDSKDMTDDVWLRLARRINEILAADEADGVVVLHGTDTLEETAYFLHLTVHSQRPVVLTGAMRPATAISADGPMNLLDAVRTAASPEAAGKGVLTVMNGEINGAREVCKANTLTASAFRAPQLGLLGYVSDGRPSFYQAPLRRHTTGSEFHADDLTSLPYVKIVYGHAGDDGLFVEAAVKAGARGIIYAGTGNGSVHRDAEAALTAAARRGVIVVRASRTGSGAVVPEDPLAEGTPFLSAGTLSPQKARILLQLALTRTDRPQEIQRMFLTY